MPGLRIVAGALKGRRLGVPRGSSIRPTPERVREALFDILGERILGAVVLDAYSGTGALGFEALSRGAARVVFVELEPRAAEALRSNVERLGVAGRATVIERDMGRIDLRAIRAPCHLVLADPPYVAGATVRLLELIADRGLLAAGGLVVAERASRESPPALPSGWVLARAARYGSTTLDFVRRAGA